MNHPNLKSISWYSIYGMEVIAHKVNYSIRQNK